VAAPAGAASDAAAAEAEVPQSLASGKQKKKHHGLHKKE